MGVGCEEGWVGWGLTWLWDGGKRAWPARVMVDGCGGSDASMPVCGVVCGMGWDGVERGLS